MRWIWALAALVAGTALLVWSVRTAGTAAVLDGVARVGAGFLVVCLLGGVRAGLRTLAWRLCLDENERPSFPTMLSAYLAGDAMGNITPFGALASEPLKAALIGRDTTRTASVSAVAVENLFYGGSVIAMLVVGTLLLLLSFDVGVNVRAASLAVLGSACVIGAAMTWIVATRRRVMTNVLSWRVMPAAARSRLGAARDVEDRVYGFAAAHPDRIGPLVALEILYHVTAVIESWVVLERITGRAPSLLAAFLLEYVNRAITIAFQFVPLWIGVDEAGTGLATTLLHLGGAAGVSLALVRKARVIVWTAVGVVLFAGRAAARPRAACDKLTA